MKSVISKIIARTRSGFRQSDYETAFSLTSLTFTDLKYQKNIAEQVNSVNDSASLGKRLPRRRGFLEKRRRGSLKTWRNPADPRG